jgi:hypothetical protein
VFNPSIPQSIVTVIAAPDCARGGAASCAGAGDFLTGTGAPDCALTLSFGAALNVTASTVAAIKAPSFTMANSPSQSTHSCLRIGPIDRRTNIRRGVLTLRFIHVHPLV